LPLSHARVSGRHAYLQLIGGRLACVDLDSRTGTHWETGCKQSGWLDYEQAIRIGPYWIRLVGNGADGSAALRPLPRSPVQSFAQHSLPEVTLELVSRDARSWTWQMTRPLALVGKSATCPVQLSIPASLIQLVYPMET
jgi:hypothetical protein